jgi:hypothetical protein
LDDWGLDFPAFDRAIAIACFWGRPDFISVRILAEIIFWDWPDLSGIWWWCLGYGSCESAGSEVNQIG